MCACSDCIGNKKMHNIKLVHFAEKALEIAELEFWHELA